MTPVPVVRAAASTSAEEWREALGAVFSRLRPEDLAGGVPSGRLTAVHVGSLSTFEVSGSPQVVRRTAAAVREAPTDQIKLCLQVRGRATVHQGEREVVIGPGQMALYDTSLPYDIRLEGTWSSAVIVFRRDALALPRRVLGDALMQSVRLADGSGAVLAEFVAAMRRCGALGPVAAERLGEAGLHLIAGTLSETAPAGFDAAADAMRMRVFSYVRAHLDDPDLSHARVAAVHRMAPRTLTRLFQDEPVTVAEYVRNCRLEAVRRDLGDPRLAHRSIAALAARWCFTDQAHFSRAFRTRFSTTASEARRIALSGS